MTLDMGFFVSHTFWISEGRHKQDTENRLRANIQEQKQLNEAALQAELDLKAKQIDQKIQVSQA